MLLPKIHKVGITVRPVVSFSKTPISTVEKSLYTRITEQSNFKPRHPVIISLDFAVRKTNFSFDNSMICISYDFSNLFTSIAKSESVSLVNNLLMQPKVTEHNIIKIITYNFIIILYLLLHIIYYSPACLNFMLLIS